MDKQTAETVVKVLAILGYIGAALGVIGGLSLLLGGGALGMMGGYGYGMMGGFLGFGFAFFGIVMIAIGVVSFFVARGLWNHENWSRIWAMVVEVVNAVFFPNVLGIIIALGIIYLLGFDKDVTALFGAKPFADLTGSSGSAPAKKSKGK